MVALVLRIVLRSLVTLFLLTACVFFALHLTGDPARIMLGRRSRRDCLGCVPCSMGTRQTTLGTVPGLFAKIPHS